MGWMTKGKSWAVPALLVITFFAWSWGQDWLKVEDWTRTGKMLFALAGAGLMAGVYVGRRFHWTVGIFFGFVILRWVSLRMAPVSMVEVTMITASVFAAIFVYQEDDKNLLGNCLVIDGFLQASLGLIEVAGFFPFLEISPELRSIVWPPIAAHGHPTILGPYLVATLAFIPGAFQFLERWHPVRDVARVIAFAVIITCILLTQSTMTMAALLVVVMLAIGFYFGTRAMALSCAGLAVLGGCIIKLYPAVAATSGRLPHWAFAWKNLTPLGYGPGTWMPIYMQKYVGDWRAYQEAQKLGAAAVKPDQQFFGQLHNDWLQGVFEFGWIGMAPLFLALIVVSTITLKAILLRRRELFPYAALFFTLAVNASGNFILHTMPAGALLAIGAIYIFRYDFEDSGIRGHYRALEKNL